MSKIKRSLGQQFADKMKRRTKLDKFRTIVADVGRHMERQIKERTRRGQPLPSGGRWDTPYNKRYSERHSKSTVNLRLSGQSMNNLRSRTMGAKRVGIQGNQLLRMHNDGTAKGGKRRQIAPETHEQVPRQMRSMIKFKVKEILSGGKGQ